MERRLGTQRDKNAFAKKENGVEVFRDNTWIVSERFKSNWMWYKFRKKWMEGTAFCFIFL